RKKLGGPLWPIQSQFEPELTLSGGQPSRGSPASVSSDQGGGPSRYQRLLMKIAIAQGGLCPPRKLLRFGLRLRIHHIWRARPAILGFGFVFAAVRCSRTQVRSAAGPRASLAKTQACRAGRLRCDG